MVNIKYKFGAGMFIVVIIIYFTLFIYTVNSAVNVSNEYDLTGNDSSLDSGGFHDDGIVNVDPVGECQNPRHRLNIDYGAGTYEEVPTGLADTMNCQFTSGMLDNSTCESIAGCEWVVRSYWFRSDETVCDGYIDGTEYDIDIRTNILGMQRVAEHNNTGIGERPSICNHPSVIHDQDLCEAFLCTWDTDQEQDVGYQTIYSTVKTLFTFQYDFGVDNAAITGILNFFLIALPLFVLLISVYLIIPFIH